MSKVDSVKQEWTFVWGAALALAVATACYLAVRWFPAASLASQVGLGFLFCGALVGYLYLFTIAIPWFVRANRDLSRPAPPGAARDTVER